MFIKFIFIFYVYLLLFPGLNGGGIERYRNHNYLFSWKSSDPRVANAKWDWFNARNYCRKRCMDLVSFETQDEYEWVKQRMSGEYGSFFLLPISFIAKFLPSIIFWSGSSQLCCATLIWPKVKKTFFNFSLVVIVLFFLFVELIFVGILIF